MIIDSYPSASLSSYGAHLPGGKDLRPAVRQAQELGFGALQVFLHGPTTAKMPEDTEAADLEAAAAVEAVGLELFVHGPYLMNFSSGREEVRESSEQMLRRNVARAAELGAKGVVYHGGSSTGDSREKGLQRARYSLLPLLESLPADGPKVLLEPTAGQGSSVVDRLEAIPAYLEALDHHPLLGLCLDTAHLLGAGEPLDEEDGVGNFLGRIEALGLMERVELFHLNDSKALRGSRRDLHQNLGFGHCHGSLWGELMGSGVPLILETPAGNFQSDIDKLRALSAREGE